MLLISPVFSYSSVVEGLYRGSVEVDSQQVSARQQGFNEALINVLLKLTGDKNLATDPAVHESLFPAERYVQRFSYRENSRYLDYLSTQAERLALEEDSLVEKSSQVQDSASDFQDLELKPSQYIFDVEFSAIALNKKLKAMNISVWGNVRPAIMLWGVVESSGIRDLIGLNEQNDMIMTLSETAKSYGLPLIFPQGDTQDKKSLSMSDLWGLFPEAIDQAKPRYDANGNVMVRFYESAADQWTANWFFELNELAYSGASKNQNLNELSEDLVGFIAKILSERFSVQVDSSDALKANMNLHVTNVSTFKDYIDVQQFLKNLAPVKSISVSWIKGTSLGLQVELSGSQSQFNEFIGLSGKLQYIEMSTLPVSESNERNERNDLEALNVGVNDSLQGTRTVDDLVINDAKNQSITIETKVVERYKWLPSNIQ